MKKILGLGVVAMLIMALVAGGTWAYFSDYQSSSNNVLAAGTLDIGLSNASNNNTGGDTSVTWSFANMAPGNSTSGVLYISNNGTIPINTVNLGTQYVVSGTVPPTVKAGPGGASDNIDSMIYISAATWNGSPVAALAGKSIYQLSTQNITLGNSLAAGSQASLNVTWTFNTSATNGCQGRTATMNVTIYGLQQ